MPTLRIALALRPSQVPPSLGPGLPCPNPSAFLTPLRRDLERARPGTLVHRAARVRLRLVLRAIRRARVEAGGPLRLGPLCPQAALNP